MEPDLFFIDTIWTHIVTLKDFDAGERVEQTVEFKSGYSGDDISIPKRHAALETASTIRIRSAEATISKIPQYPPIGVGEKNEAYDIPTDFHGVDWMFIR